MFAPVEAEVPLPGEEERFDAAVLEILGEEIFSSDDLDALDAITDEQFELIMQIPDEETKTVVVNQQVGLIHAPWAVDAEGNAVETSYNLVDGTLTQTVVTDKNTAFPVVADPKFKVTLTTTTVYFSRNETRLISQGLFTTGVGAVWFPDPLASKLTASLAFVSSAYVKKMYDHGSCLKLIRANIGPSTFLLPYNKHENAYCK